MRFPNAQKVLMVQKKVVLLHPLLTEKSACE